jgi:WD40 repeat protein
MLRLIDRWLSGSKRLTGRYGPREEPAVGGRSLAGHHGTVYSLAVLSDGLRALSGSADGSIQLWDLATGAELPRFEGRQGRVHSVAVLPDGRRAISGSSDDSMRLWDLETRKALRRFDGHNGSVRAVAPLPDGRRGVSGSDDNTIRLWDLETGAELRRLSGHSHWVLSVAVLPNGRQVLSGSADDTMCLWDLETGTELRRFQGHGNSVRAIAVLPDQPRALSGSDDGTMRLWDLDTGAELRRFAGHTHPVWSIALLPDGRRAFSGSADGTLRLWDMKTGAELRRFEGHTGAVYSLAVLPDGRRVLSGSEDGTLRLSDIETIGAANVGYTTARIALLGDSGVGKTGLGWRIAHGEFREQASTHGQQFWVIDQLGGVRGDGTLCETVLWDLAGQPDYRLIHALFLDKVDLGLLLFDATNRERPLAGVEYWVRHLRSATLRNSARVEPFRSSAPTLLIAARADRGTPSLGAPEIDDFRQRHGIGAYVVTSAKDNVGIVELIERIKETIPWDRLTATTTTRTFKRIKEHVLALKQSSGREAALLRPDELRRQLERSDSNWSFTDAEMMTAVGHLASHGYVTLLQRASGEEVILLAPDLLVNLASYVVLEARRHERGLGLIDERRLLAGGYPFPDFGDLSPDVRTALLDAVGSLFLQRNLCFRESINERACLVFPSLINEKRPPTSDLRLRDDVSYSVSGNVETLYSALVVQLGYTNLFRRDHHWQNQAQYELLEPGKVCGFRQTFERDGEIELVLSHGDGTGDDARKLFQGVFELFLKRRPVHIRRLPEVSCANRHTQVRAAVREAIDDSRPFFYCNTCGAQIATPRIDDIGIPAERHVDHVRKAEETADRRTKYEVAIGWVKAFRRDRGYVDAEPTCFLSYAWGNRQHEQWVERLADHLQNADVAVIFDRWHNTPGTSITGFIERIRKSDFVCPLGTPNYGKKGKADDADSVVQAELLLIKSKIRKRGAIRDTVIPLLCEGRPEEAFPPLLEDSVFVDFRTEADFFARLFDLILTLHGIPFQEDMARKHRNELLGEMSASTRIF